MTAARLQVPPRIVEGDVFKLRLLVQHPMDSGFLRNLEGVLVKRNVIRQLKCIYHDMEVFRVEPTTGTAANATPVPAINSNGFRPKRSANKPASGCKQKDQINTPAIISVAVCLSKPAVLMRYFNMYVVKA